MHLALALPLSFAVGSIPFGWLAFRTLRGQDVRQVGSGNIGATNVARQFGGPWRYVVFFAIYLFDMGKGFGPVRFLAGGATAGALVGLAAVAGHCFSPFLRFKGGKGVATASGVLLALDWLAFLVAIAVFGLTLLTTRVVALSSILLGFALALTVILREPATAFAGRLPVTLLSIFLALFLVWTHRSNLRKLLADRARPGQSA
jgi:glycerol-3-phosphate acyltransferase PlsY